MKKQSEEEKVASLAIKLHEEIDNRIRYPQAQKKYGGVLDLIKKAVWEIYDLGKLAERNKIRAKIGDDLFNLGAGEHTPENVARIVVAATTLIDKVDK